MLKSRAVDTAMLGYTGVLEPMAGLGRVRSTMRCVARSNLNCIQVAAGDFRRVADEFAALKMMCIDYNEKLLGQTRMQAARYALLPIEARLAVCLAEVSLLLGSDTVPLRQGTLAEMLGVRRTSVSEVASKMEKAGIIGHSRGAVCILDAARLQRMADWKDS